MAELKKQLQDDLAAAMKNKDTIAKDTLRMTLTAITNEEVSGKEAIELSDAEVQRVLTREVKKRKEAAETFTAAGRDELATAELAEADFLTGYLPAQLSDDELAALVDQVIAELTAELGEKPGQKQLGQVMKLANAKVAGRAEGGRVAGLVKARLLG